MRPANPPTRLALDESRAALTRALPWKLFTTILGFFTGMLAAHQVFLALLGSSFVADATRRTAVTDSVWLLFAWGAATALVFPAPFAAAAIYLATGLAAMWIASTGAFGALSIFGVAAVLLAFAALLAALRERYERDVIDDDR